MNAYIIWLAALHSLHISRFGGRIGSSDREKQIANELTSIGVHANFGTGFTVIMKLPGRSHHQINAISLSSRLSAKINYNDDKVSRKLSAGVFRMQCEKNIS